MGEATDHIERLSLDMSVDRSFIAVVFKIAH